MIDLYSFWIGVMCGTAFGIVAGIIIDSWIRNFTENTRQAGRG